MFIWLSCGRALFTICFFLFVFLKQRQEQNDNAVKLRLHRRAVETSSPHRDGKLAEASPEKTLTVISVCHALYKAYVNTVSFKFTALRICCGFTPNEITSAARQTQLSATHLFCQTANHQSHRRLPFYRKGLTDECWHQHWEWRRGCQVQHACRPSATLSAL